MLQYPVSSYVPESLPELSRILSDLHTTGGAHRSLRVVGAFFSSQPLPETPDVLVSMKKLDRVLSFEGKNKRKCNTFNKQINKKKYIFLVAFRFCV